MRPSQVNALVASSFPQAFRSGLRCEELGEGWAVARWKYDPETLRPGGYISGPTLFSAADVSLWFATFTVIGLVPMAVTSDLAIHFLRPALGDDVLARAEVLRIGKTRIYGEVRLWVDGRPDELVAHATGSYAPPS
ncbi:MAG TPA: PaaI family thioesterase [Acidimicrobiia bacterium]|nr:PaaI family thioesterase [Acidimicrobiia bacterium]